MTVLFECAFAAALFLSQADAEQTSSGLKVTEVFKALEPPFVRLPNRTAVVGVSFRGADPIALILDEQREKHGDGFGLPPVYDVVSVDLKARKELRRFRLPADRYGLIQMERQIKFARQTLFHCSADCQRIAVVGKEEIGVWDASTGKNLCYVRHGKRLSLSPDGGMLATAADHCVYVWDCDTGKEVVKLSLPGKKPAFDPDRIRFAPDGSKIAVTDDRTIHTFQLPSGEHLASIWEHVGQYVPLLAWSADGEWIAACGSEDGVVRFWDADTATGRATLSFRGLTKTPMSIWIGPDAKKAATVDDAQQVVTWELVSGNALKAGRILKPRPRGIDPHSVVFEFWFSPDGQQAAATGSGDTIVLINRPLENNLANAEKLKDDSVLGELACSPSNFCLSHDASLAAVDTRRNGVLLWDLDRDLVVRRLGEAPAGGLRSITFAPDDSVLAMTTHRQTKLWEVKSGRLLSEITHQQPPVKLLRYPQTVTRCAFSPNGDRLVFVDGNAFVVWNVNDKAMVKRIVSPYPIYYLSFVDENRLTAAGDSTIRGWDLDTGSSKIMVPFLRDPRLSRPAPVVVSVSENCAALGPEFEVVSIFDFKRGSVIRRHQSDKYNRQSWLSLATNGRYVAVGGHRVGSGAESDVWDLRTGRLVTTTPVRFGPARSVISDDARRVLASDNQTIKALRVGN